MHVLSKTNTEKVSTLFVTAKIALSSKHTRTRNWNIIWLMNCITQESAIFVLDWLWCSHARWSSSPILMTLKFAQWWLKAVSILIY